MQAELEAAIERVTGRAVTLTVAGRTDAGVHALGQVASHDGEPVPASALNGVLPGDVRIVTSEAAPDGFDARRDARARLYRYRLFRREAPSAFEADRTLHWPRPLDRGALDACARSLRGTHDFRAFTPTDTHHVRFERDVSRSEWIDVGEHGLDFAIEADTFMRHMVRTLVGTMLAVAGGRMEVARFQRLLTGRPREEAGDTAPAHGLYLVAVRF